MKLATGVQMRNIDRWTIDRAGVPGLDLMERAGEGVFAEVQRILGVVQGKVVAIFCGKGNNGGDGFVVARLAAQAGARVCTFLLGEGGTLKGDAHTNWTRLGELGLAIMEIRGDSDSARTEETLARADVVVDAIFGTGLRGGVSGLSGRIIETINACGRPVVSVDVPSGLCADTGRSEGPCVRARSTVTFGLAKIGQFMQPGRALCGDVRVVDIGLSLEAIENESSSVYVTTAEEVRNSFPIRPPDAHKGSCGRVVVIAGSVGMTGAAALTSSAALRMGAGLVTLGVAESLNDILEVKLTEVMTKPLPEVRKRRCLSLRAVGEIRRMAEGSDCMAIGPGLSTHRETSELVRRVVSDVSVPIVLDADGLNALAGQIELLKGIDAPTVITPHPGEFSRLTGMKIEEIVDAPLDISASVAVAYGVTVVLKGAPTVVATESGETFINPTGNAGMATGGAGDVLTGMIAGLIGQGLESSVAARIGVYLHGLAGDLAREEKGEFGLVAGDLAAFLPAATRCVQRGYVDPFLVRDQRSEVRGQ